MKFFTSTSILLALSTSSLAVVHEIQCFTEADCTGDAGDIHYFDEEGPPNFCLETIGRKSCFWKDGHNNNGAGRFIGGNQCGAYDTATGCTTGGGCVELMHPNGIYYDYQRVDERTSSLCFFGKREAFIA
jgi:hypothetical protein